jgi:hypothetical protein
MAKLHIVKDPRFTKREQLAVVTEAIKLIKDPQFFKQGDWVCPITKWDAEKREYIPLVSEKGEILYQMCIEGAVNRAVFNLFGKARAFRLGAYGTFLDDTLSINKENENELKALTGYLPTALLSLNKQAYDLFPDDLHGENPRTGIENEVDGSGSLCAQHINDADDTSEAHERVMKILRTKQRELRKALKASK